MDVGSEESPYYLDGHGPYQMKSVTGVDPAVIEVVGAQKAEPHAIAEAIVRIESFDLHEFAFLCHGATHRSLAMAMLLLKIAYSRGVLQPTTWRTHEAVAEVCSAAQPADLP